MRYSHHDDTEKKSSKFSWITELIPLLQKIIRPKKQAEESIIIESEKIVDSPVVDNDSENNLLAEFSFIREHLIDENSTLLKKSSTIPIQLTMIQVAVLQTLLQNFVSQTNDVQGAALVTPDGLPLTSILPINMDEERVSAMSAALLSLGERIGQELVRGEIERIFVEGTKGYSILVGCGADAVLLVLASETAKKGLLFLEIKRLVAEITPLLA